MYYVNNRMTEMLGVAMSASKKSLSSLAGSECIYTSILTLMILAKD